MRPRDRRRRNRRRVAIGWIVAVVLAFAMLIPNALVLVGTRRATACIKGYEGPRGAELPWCGDAMGWFSLPARVPWTVTPATYRAEELRVRIAMGHYTNAIAGKPDRDARAKAAELMAQANTIVTTGSRRLAFEELGPAVGKPDPGQDALLHGDRDTLLARPKDWTEWHQRLHTLRAALVQGDLPSALDIAKHYATWDPREEDLRAAMGAVLCLGGETQRGMDMFVLMQNDRAARRYAAMARDWGDVRTALLACAAIGKVTPPPRPATSPAGEDDHRVVRAPLRLRVVEDHDNRLREAQESAEQLLTGALPQGSRAPILAALLASGATYSPERWADLATARAADGEGPMLDLGSVSVVSWMEVPADRPIAVGSVMRRGAERLMEIAAGLSGADDAGAGAGAKGNAGAKGSAQGESKRGSKQGADSRAAAGSKPGADSGAAAGSPTGTGAAGAGAELRAKLETAAAALWVEGARAYVRAADTKSALEMLERAAPLVKMDATTRALAEGLVRYATGDVEGASTVLSAAPAQGAGEPPELAAALATLRAEVSFDFGPPKRELAEAAYSAAEKTKSAAVRAWARRVRFWAAPEAEPPADVQIGSLDAMAGRFALWPSLGYANRTAQWGEGDDLRLSILGKNLGVWSRARSASEPDKRAFRYALLRHRGDMPDALVPYLAVAGELAGEGADVEVWLDAVMATDAPRFSMRTYAWARANAARARGDRAAYDLWMTRFKALAEIAGDERKAELARLLGM